MSIKQKIAMKIKICLFVLIHMVNYAGELSFLFILILSDQINLKNKVGENVNSEAQAILLQRSLP